MFPMTDYCTGPRGYHTRCISFFGGCTSFRPAGVAVGLARSLVCWQTGLPVGCICVGLCSGFERRLPVLWYHYYCFFHEALGNTMANTHIFPPVTLIIIIAQAALAADFISSLILTISISSVLSTFFARHPTGSSRPARALRHCCCIALHLVVARRPSHSHLLEGSCSNDTTPCSDFLHPASTSISVFFSLLSACHGRRGFPRAARGSGTALRRYLDQPRARRLAHLLPQHSQHSQQQHGRRKL